MGWLDRVEDAGQLYIGGLLALRRRDAVRNVGITHVVSVLRYHLDEQMTDGLIHLQIEVDDEDEENLLEHLPTTTKFIEDALDGGGCVFVHCAMGKSRSATVVIAYLMHKLHVSPTEGLRILQQYRGVCEPNPGFMKQLWLFHDMHLPTNIASQPQYQRWLYQRDLDLSRAIRQAPEVEKIRFEDEYSVGGSKAGLEFKCRKCRRTLATSQYLAEHRPKQRPDAPAESSEVPATACAHYFVDALSWMRPELEKGKLEGRLECPKCKNNVGKYAWQGMQCSCGDWVVPGISLSKGRIDEAKTRSQNQDSGPAEVSAIRLPPGHTKRPGHL